ncbi:transposase zinc-binding domain-containing protein [Salmonella enterica]|nr:transposase zinc-binding domain-containing protein [Salmonella enterica]
MRKTHFRTVGNTDCSHSRFFCQSCKSKSCSSCGFKATEQWVS